MRKYACPVIIRVVISFVFLTVLAIIPASISASPVPLKVVQLASATPQAHLSSLAVRYPYTQTAGNFNLVIVGWNDAVAVVRSVTDTLGNTYTLAVGPLRGIGLTQSIYYAKNITGGANSVTVTFNQAAVIPDIRILEYQGLSTTAPLDVTAQAKGTSGQGAVVGTGSATTASAAEVIFAAGTTGGVFAKPGNMFTTEVITSDGDIAEQRIVSAAGNYSSTATLGNYAGQNWVMQMVTLKAAADSGQGGGVGVTVSPNTGTLQSGRSLQFNSQVTGTSNTAVTWNAVHGSVSSSGLYKAPAVTSETADTVTAISAADPTKYARASVTITVPGSNNGNVYEYWVSPSTGSDSNDGSQSRPWATITKADSALQLGPDGTIVHLMSGTYGNSHYEPVTVHNGKPSQRIQFLCDVQYSCLFNNTFWRSQGNYVDIIGVQVTAPNIGAAFYFGTNSTDPSQSSGNYSSLRDSYIHNVGTTCASYPNGGAVGIYNVTHDVTFDSNILDNTGVPGGCPSSNGLSNHWIYLQGYNATVTNNIISNAAGYGIQSYHNNCNSVIANNTVVHNFVGGIMVDGADWGYDGPSPCPVGSRGLHTSINNNLVIRNGYGCGQHISGAIGGVQGGIILESNGGNNGAGTLTDQLFNNYSVSNYPGTGDSSCTNVAGSNNKIIVFYSMQDCYKGACALPDGVTAASQGTNRSSTSLSNLVVNYQNNAWTGNFHLLSTSPAVGAGTNGNCAPSPGISPCIPIRTLDGILRDVSAEDIGALGSE